MKSNDKAQVKRLKLLRAIILIALLVIFPIVAEFTFRIFKHTAKDIIKPHPFLLWKFAPDLTDQELKINSYITRIDTNSEGLRNEKVDPERSDRSFRILCVGDESTLGLGVDQSDTWTKILQTLIRTRFHFFLTEVINAGGLGYSSGQGVETVREYCARYKPEILIVSFLHNDYALETKSDSDRIPQGETNRKIAGALYNSQIFLHLQGFIYNSFASGESTSDFRVNARVSPSQFRANLEQIASIARNNGAVVIFINPQARLNDKEPSAYRRIIRDVAEKNGIYLDINQDFSKNHLLYLNGGAIPGKEGHKLIAGRIFELIAYANLMPRQKNMPAGEIQVPPSVKEEKVPVAEKHSDIPEGKNGKGVENKQREKGLQQKSDEPGKPGNPPGSDDFYF